VQRAQLTLYLGGKKLKHGRRKLLVLFMYKIMIQPQPFKTSNVS